MSELTLSPQTVQEPVPFISLIPQHQSIADEVTSAVGRLLFRTGR